VPGRTLVDALAAYDFGALDTRLEGAALAVNVKNLFDKDYITCVAANGCRYGAPRLVTATLSYRW
jgi:iron complex outermembrane receptor protein